jgi:IS5 family transposase
MKKTRRALFLEEMERTMPWSELYALAEPLYRKSTKCHAPAGIACMLRIYFLQQWFGLTDYLVEEMLYESSVMRQFAGVDIDSEPVPDELLICEFRNLLEEHDLGEDIRARVNRHLLEKGLHISTGDLLDAEIVHAASSSKSGEPG